MSSPSKIGVAQPPVISQSKQVIADVRTTGSDNHALLDDEHARQTPFCQSNADGASSAGQ